MELMECIKSRRSVRKYTDEPITHEVIEEIIDAARFSPSWKNTQIVRYNIVEDKEVMNKIATDCVLGFEFNTKTLSRATAILVVSYITKRCGYERDGSFSTAKEDRWEMFDAGVATQTFCLAAHDKGVGTCIMGIFDEEKIAELIELPENQKIGAVIAMGYPVFSPDAPPRKEVSDLVKYV